jgi:plasmid stability protein
MATLHVRNVPDDLYERLRRRAEAEGRSLSAEVIRLLDSYLPRRSMTPEERKAYFDRVNREREEMRKKYGEFPDSVADIRWDREHGH